MPGNTLHECILPDWFSRYREPKRIRYGYVDIRTISDLLALKMTGTAVKNNCTKIHINTAAKTAKTCFGACGEKKHLQTFFLARGSKASATISSIAAKRVPQLESRAVLTCNTPSARAAHMSDFGGKVALAQQRSETPK